MLITLLVAVITATAVVTFPIGTWNCASSHDGSRISGRVSRHLFVSQTAITYHHRSWFRAQRYPCINRRAAESRAGRKRSRMTIDKSASAGSDTVLLTQRLRQG